MKDNITKTLTAGLMHGLKVDEVLEGELFKQYPLNEGYLVSNKGRIYSASRIVKHSSGVDALRKGRFLTLSLSEKGYLRCGISFEGKTRSTSVARMVAITWVDNPENKPQVNHLDGDKLNNTVDNLEWCTCQENILHAIESGLYKGYVRSEEYRKKASEKQKMAISIKHELYGEEMFFDSVRSCAKYLGVNASTISMALTRGNKSKGHVLKRIGKKKDNLSPDEYIEVNETNNPYKI